MRCRVFIFLSLLSVSFYSHPANAGPDQTTDWLMDEKASIFDLGMMRLGTRLEGIEESWPVGFLKPIVSYKWDEDVIQIYVFSFQESKSVKGAKDGCREAFEIVRRSAGGTKRTEDCYLNPITLFSVICFLTLDTLLEEQKNRISDLKL